MQINASSQSIAPPASSDVGRPKGPPPPPPAGSVPPGLDTAVQTLSTEEQTAVTEMLANLSKDQQSTLKAQLDALREDSSTLSEEEMGSAFKDMLTSITGTPSGSSPLNQVDIFA
ncbi:MAG: hypothetical protein ACJA13_003417 [Paraglaciecola sp.]|jgi:hypothetical protein